MAPPSSPAHLQCSPAPQQGSPAPFASLPSSRLQDKHQKLIEHQGLCGFLSSVPSLPLSLSPSPDSHPSHCREDDLTKPKGKRPCKTKHTKGETGQEEAEVGGAEDKENGMVRKLCLQQMALSNGELARNVNAKQLFRQPLNGEIHSCTAGHCLAAFKHIKDQTASAFWRSDANQLLKFSTL